MWCEPRNVSSVNDQKKKRKEKINKTKKQAPSKDTKIHSSPVLFCVLSFQPAQRQAYGHR